MQHRKTIKLRRSPDPRKIALSQELKLRFVDIDGRYILQSQVFYAEKQESTWVHVPLVPETYGGAT